MVEGRNIIATAGAVVAAIIGFNTVAQRNAEGEITEAGIVDAFEIRVGDCFNDDVFESPEITEISALPCSEPHDNQAYAAYDLSGEWPGDDQVQELAYTGCYERFADAIGQGYEDSVLDYAAIYPSEGSWKRRDDREVICVGYHMEYEKLTGSIISSGM